MSNKKEDQRQEAIGVLEELLKEFKKDELKEAEQPYSHHAEIWDGMERFIDWLRAGPEARNAQKQYVRDWNNVRAALLLAKEHHVTLEVVVFSLEALKSNPKQTITEAVSHAVGEWCK